MIKMSKVEIYQVHPLFEDVQLNHILPDGKTFVDCVPLLPLEAINEKYLQLKTDGAFDLKKFVHDHFELPVPHSVPYSPDEYKPVEKHIDDLWDVLTRQPKTNGSVLGSIISLPFPYIVPGGRFGEIYYWDSYFTMLGLKLSGRNEMIENMVKNFSHLIETRGYIPNGNRTYYLGRSHPPFYSLMVLLLAGIKGKQALIAYLPFLVKEYDYWMKGMNELDKTSTAACHVVRMPGGEILNRYWDEHDTPRPESFREDVELAARSGREVEPVYRHLRAGAESGWDYSSRWFKQADSFASIHTTDIVPVDLNCLLFHLEETIAMAFAVAGDEASSSVFRHQATKRKEAIQHYCWNNQQGFYFDYDVVAHSQKEVISLAALFPLFFGMAGEQQAAAVAKLVEEKMLMSGGVVNSLEATGQQWDYPNGWAPLHWITITGLEKYGFIALAKDIALRWIKLNSNVYQRTGKLMEKYNVVDTGLEAGGGEYSGQDGFGWTNGVLLALMDKYGGMRS
jgi:alpha,alpha-trehalase